METSNTSQLTDETVEKLLQHFERSGWSMFAGPDSWAVREIIIKTENFAEKTGSITILNEVYHMPIVNTFLPEYSYGAIEASLDRFFNSWELKFHEWNSDIQDVYGVFRESIGELWSFVGEFRKRSEDPKVRYMRNFYRSLLQLDHPPYTNLESYAKRGKDNIELREVLFPVQSALLKVIWSSSPKFIEGYFQTAEELLAEGEYLRVRREILGLDYDDCEKVLTFLELQLRDARDTWEIERLWFKS